LVFDINDELDYIIFNEGRILYNVDDSSFNFEYHLRDHLGSTRVAFVPAAQSTEIVQENSYYPFGAPINDLSWSPKSTNRYLREGKEYISDFDWNKYDFTGRTFDSWTLRSLQVDPMATGYYSVSPYALWINNPINFIDPNGMDVYRYDDKTGEMSLFKKTDDDFDQIGKFKYDKKTDTYTLKEKKDGTAKTRIDNIEKGILSDGMNFKTNDNVINVSGEGQATVGGFENFITQFSDMVNKEIAGFYFTPAGGNDISQIYVGNFKNNTDQKAFATPKLQSVRPDLVGKLEVNTAFHTHLSRFPESAKLVPSGLSLPGGDMAYKRGQIANGIKRFIILTTGYPPIQY
jgi:RHS repeat-associated protein